MRIYLDDIRSTPEGYVRTYTVEETIELIKQNDGNVESLSLDNDLGSGYTEGYEVMKWIEEQAYYNTLQPIPNLFAHTDNNVAEEKMMQARYNAWKYWKGHGYDWFKIQEKDYI